MNLKLSRTALRELTRLYRGVLFAAIISAAFVVSGANATDVSTAAELATALQDASEAIKVTGDIAGISTVTTVAEKTNTLNLNEKTLSGAAEGTSGFAFSGSGSETTLTGGGTISGLKRPDTTTPTSVNGDEYGVVNVGAAASLTMTDGNWTFSGNNGGLGALNALNGSIEANVGTIAFENNTSTTQGGGFRHDVSDSAYSDTFARITANEIKFEGNTIGSTAVVGSGAGAMNSRGTMELLGTTNTFENNDMNATVADGRKYKVGGGAVANQSGENSGTVYNATMVIGKANGSSTNTFTGNHSSSNGGAIMNRAVDDDGNATLTINGNTTFSGNTTAGKGGAIYNAQTGEGRTATVTINGGALFENNTANGEANDIYNLGTLVLNAADGKSIVLNGGIDGDAEYKGNTTITREGTGYVQIANALKNQNVTNNGELRLDGADLTGTTIGGSGTTKVIGDSEVSGNTTIEQDIEVESGQELAINNATISGNGALENAAGGTLKITDSVIKVDVNNAGTLISDPTDYYGTVTNTGVAGFDADTFKNTAVLANSGIANMSNGVTFETDATITGAGTTNLVEGTTHFNNTASSNTINIVSGADFDGTLVSTGTVNIQNGAIDTITGVVNGGKVAIDVNTETNTGDAFGFGSSATISSLNVMGGYGTAETSTIAAAGLAIDSSTAINGGYYTKVEKVGDNLVLSDKLINTSTIRGTGDGSTTFVGDVKIGNKADNTQIGTTNVNLTVDNSDKEGSLVAGVEGNGAKIGVTNKDDKKKAEMSADWTNSGHLYTAGVNANATDKQVEMSAEYYADSSDTTTPTKSALIRTSADSTGSKVEAIAETVSVDGSFKVVDGTTERFTVDKTNGNTTVGGTLAIGAANAITGTAASGSNPATLDMGANALTNVNGITSKGSITVSDGTANADKFVAENDGSINIQNYNTTTSAYEKVFEVSAAGAVTADSYAAGTNGTALADNSLTLHDGTYSTVLSAVQKGTTASSLLNVSTGMNVNGDTTVGGTLGVTGTTTLSTTNGLQFGTGQNVKAIDAGSTSLTAKDATTLATVGTVLTSAENADFTGTTSTLVATTVKGALSELGAENAVQNTVIGAAMNADGTANTSALTLKTKAGAAVTNLTDAVNLIGELSSTGINATTVAGQIGNVGTTVAARTSAISNTNTVAANLLALDTAIGANVTSTNNIAAANSVNANLSLLDADIGADTEYGTALNGVAQTATVKTNITKVNTALTAITGGQVTAGGVVQNDYLSGTGSAPSISYAALTDDSTITLATAIGQINTNIGTEITGAATRTTGAVAGTATVNANLKALDAAIGVDVTTIAATTVKTAAGDNNGVVATNTINQNISQLNAAVGDIATLSAGTAATGDAITKGTGTAAKTVVEALNNIDATMGNIHGLYDGTTVNSSVVASTVNGHSNLAVGTTVEDHLVSIDNAIGDRNQFDQSHYMDAVDSVADAMMSVDHNLYRVEKEMRGGFASMAAMSALVPNARAAGDTQVSVGVGAYRDHQGIAVGGFHYFNDNILANVGVSYGGDRSTVFRAGVTFGW